MSISFAPSPPLVSSSSSSSNMVWQSLRNGLADVPRRWTLRF
jgi:hypothetical protein